MITNLSYYNISDEQMLLLETVRETLLKECPESYLQECDKTGVHPQKFEDALVKSGANLLMIPEEYGGIPCSSLTYLMVAEEIAKCGCPAYMYGSSLMVDDMLSFGSKEQIEIIMNEAKKGKLFPFALGITEPGAGSDNNAMTTTATRKNGKVYINGQKTFCSNFLTVNYTLVLTRDLENPNPKKAISMWLVPNDLPGIKAIKQDKIGCHLGNTCEVYYDNVEIPETALVGEEGKGFMNLMKNFELERLMLAAGVMGFCEAAFDDAVTYANQRIQFNQPIGNFQLTQLKITEMYTKIENMRHLLYKCAWDRDHNIPIRTSAAIAKRYVTKTGFEVLDDAMQILGGFGYTNECRVSRFWRDCRVRRIGGGTDEIMVHIAGRALLKGQL